MKRHFSSFGFLAAVLIDLGIIIIHFATTTVPYGLGNEWLPWRQGEGAVFPLTLWNVWIGLSAGSGITEIFYYILPLIVCLPLAGSLLSDRKTGYINQIVIRSNTRGFLTAKCLATFACAAIIAATPLTIDYIISACVLPMIQPVPTAATFPVFSYSLFGDLFYNNAHAYSLTYIALDAFFCGIVACLTIPLCTLFQNKFIGAFAPFCFGVILLSTSNTYSIGSISPYQLLAPYESAYVIPYEALIVYSTLLLLLVLFILLYPKYYYSEKHALCQ
ncbi:hypothetical protein [Eggerthella sinensis]|uniref:hypothetical protein n=1 Tax=Eggerthella sinensis TaxID=242230 RepID=UPI0022DFBCAD|nr:hypothetical protein [Eggerthella sinensis]